MEYSLQLYSARNFTPWKNVFKTIRDLGYSQVEGYGGAYESPEETRQLLDKNHLEMPSGHFSLDELENDLDASLKTASLLGCKHIFCPYLIEDQRPKDTAGWQSLARRLADIGNKVCDRGFQFGWHNHDFEFVACADGSIPMQLILETAPDIDWEIDVAWISRAGSDPSKWITEFKNRITSVHVKDIAAPGQCSDEDGWSDVGHGTMDWKSLFTQLQTDTRARLYIVEHDNPSDLHRFASRSLQTLQQAN